MPEPLPITYPGFEGRGLSLRPSGWVQGAAILCDGQPATRQGRSMTLTDNAGAPVVFQFKGNILDPIPAVVVGGQTIRFAKPFAWYEYVWIVLPLVLVLGGGILGGFCGGAAMLINARLLRSERPMWARYGLGALVILAALAVLVVLATLFTLVVGLSGAVPPA